MARVVELGRIAYADALAMQEETLRARIAGEIGDTVIVCEHDPVYTVGRSRGASANVLEPGSVPVVEVARGGDVTFHGPGQVVAYPILAVRDLHGHLRRLEQLMIDVCGEFGLAAGRDPRNSGAWIAGKKVGSVGVGCRRWVTWHGLALNVETDLAYFQRIHPCGMEATLITTMREAGAACTTGEVRDTLASIVARW